MKSYTVKPVLNRPFIKRNFVLNGNMASAEKCSGPLRFHLRLDVCLAVYLNLKCGMQSNGQ
jgi:hypothetical protein